MAALTVGGRGDRREIGGQSRGRGVGVDCGQRRGGDGSPGRGTHDVVVAIAGGRRAVKYWLVAAGRLSGGGNGGARAGADGSPGDGVGPAPAAVAG